MTAMTEMTAKTEMTERPTTPAAPALKPLWAVRHPPVASFAGAVGSLELPLLHPVAPLAAELSRTELRPLALRAILSSPRHRCLDLAAALARELALPLHIDPRLREVEHGRWTGHVWDVIAACDHAAYHYWLAHWISSGPPDGGESALAMTARVAAALDDAPPHSLLVTHRGPLQALHYLAGLPWPEAAVVAIPNAGEPGALWSARLAVRAPASAAIPGFTPAQASRYDVVSLAPLAPYDQRR